MILRGILWLSLMLGWTTGLKIITIGDWGDDNTAGVNRQKKVAAAMNDWCGREECAFILDTGDNFYPQGVMSVDDTRFETSWRSIYDLPNIATKQWFISIGNHDHDNASPPDTREFYQIEYSNTDPRWYYPSLWYDLYYEDEAGTKLHLIVIDSQSLRQNKNNPAVQLAWLETTLASSTGDWVVVLSHHPPYSVGGHGPGSGTIRDQVVPLCKQYNVDVLLSGHEHNLEHITKTGGGEMDYVISGGGARLLYTFNSAAEQTINSWGYQVDYWGYVYGLVSFDFTPTSMLVEFIDDNANVVYSFDRTK